MFCGDGGWTDGLLAAGYRVVGIDLVRRRAYRGELILQDVATLDGRRFRGFRLIVASPPCQAFAPWNRPAHPSEGMKLVLEAVRVIREAGPRYWVLENVRRAVRPISEVLGAPALRYGRRNAPFYLWGNFPRFMVLGVHHAYKRRHRSPWLRARIPFELSYPLALACLE